jgi:hypothetical protein
VTIHQPSMDIFESFDALVLLQRGGRLTYFGPLGRESCNLISYLESLPGVEPIRPGYNPATWMLEVTGGSMTTTFTAAGLDFPQTYADSELQKTNMRRMEEILRSCDASAGGEDVGAGGVPAPAASDKQYATPMAVQSRELLRKYFSYYWHNPQ